MHWIDINKLKPHSYGKEDILAINKDGEYRVCVLIPPIEIFGESKVIIKGTTEEFFPIRWAFIGKSGKTKKEPLKYKIGDKIKFSKCYSRKCSERFKDYLTNKCGSNKENFPLNLCLSEKKNLKELNNNINEGFIVGVRCVIMENYKYHSGGCYNAPDYDDYDPPYASGEYENVLLVTKNIYCEPFIVRTNDVYESR